MTRLGASATLLLAALFWGSGNVANKTVLDHIDPLLAVGLRCCIAFVLLVPFAWSVSRGPYPPGWFSSASGVTGSFAGAIALQQFAFAGTSVTNAGFLINTCGILTPIFAWLLLRESSHRAIILAALVTLAGVFLMTGAQLSLAAMRIGDAVSLASAACYALWMVLLGRHLRRFGQPGLMCAFQCGVCGGCFLALAMTQELPPGAQIAAALPDLLYLGIFATGCAYLLQARAQQYVSASCAAIIGSAESLFGAAGAFVLLDERMTGTGLTGAALILCGITMAALCPASLHQLPPGNGSDKSSARRRVPAG